MQMKEDSLQGKKAASHIGQGGGLGEQLVM
jgi:hypothetical protein